MSEEKKIEEMVREMAKLSVLTDKISDVQAKNLKMFPFVFFESVTKAEIEYNLSNDDTFVNDDENNDIKVSKIKTKHMKVSYFLTLDEKLNRAHELGYRFRSIEASVRNMFWKQIKVEVYFNGKLAYKSK